MFTSRRGDEGFIHPRSFPHSRKLPYPQVSAFANTCPPLWIAIADTSRSWPRYFNLTCLSISFRLPQHRSQRQYS